jgi:hypothetical protein
VLNATWGWGGGGGGSRGGGPPPPVATSPPALHAVHPGELVVWHG